MSFFRNIESIIKQYGDMGLDQVLYYFGVDLEIHRPLKDVNTDVYGSYAGNETSLFDNIVGVLVGDDFFEQDNAYAGNFQEGFLLTQYKGILVGDVLKVDSADGKVRRYKVISPDGIGTQDTLFLKYKISNLAD